MNWRYQLSELNWGKDELTSVMNIMEGGWVTAGEETQRFEAEFISAMGWANRRAVAVSSCTAAIHLALMDIGVGPGDEVIVPALTFVSCWNVVRQLGATAIYMDCDPHTGNINVDDIQKLVTPRTKAAIVVHFAGEPVSGTPNLANFLSSIGVALIEDVAHAPGASVNGHAVGGFGDYGCFSFFSNKNLAIGEGGMIVTTPERAIRLSNLRSHGMTASTHTRFTGRAFSYDVQMPGLNYRTDEIRSAIGRVQLAKLDGSNRKRLQLLKRYKHRLSEIGIEVLGASERSGQMSVAHICACLLPEGIDRNTINALLKLEGIQSSYHYPAPWSFSAYLSLINPKNFPGVSEVTSRELTLPLHPKLNSDDVDIICQVVEGFINESR